MSLDHNTETIDRSDSVAPARAGRGSNQSVMRNYNERLVLSLIRQTGPMPKAAIARATGLSAQTVSVIMRALEDDGLLAKDDPVRGKVGQPSVPMRLVPEGAFVLGLKVGRGGAELGLCDFLGDLRYYRRETYVIPAPDDIIAFTTDAVEAFVDQLPMAHRGRVAGLGIALPFRMWDWAKDATKENAAKLNGWRNRDLAAELAQVLDLPVFLCNDASAACGAELVFGTQDKPRDFLYAYVGHFVGGGLVLGNALFTGGTGNAAALASIPVTARSGEMRQLVDLASLATLDRMLAKAGEDRAAIQDRSKEWTLAPTVLEAWLDGAAYGLAQAIASSACVIDFETVVIDGSMPVSLRAELVRRTQAELQGLKVPGIALPDACEGTIGYDAKVRGAASLPLSGRFLVDRTLVSGG